MGLVDPDTLKHIQENADNMLKNPEKALEEASSAVSKIASDPEAFMREVMSKLEEKAFKLIRE